MTPPQPIATPSGGSRELLRRGAERVYWLGDYEERSALSRPMSDEYGGGVRNEVTASAGNAGRAAGGVESLDGRENKSSGAASDRKHL